MSDDLTSHEHRGLEFGLLWRFGWWRLGIESGRIWRGFERCLARLPLR